MKFNRLKRPAFFTNRQPRLVVLAGLGVLTGAGALAVFGTAREVRREPPTVEQDERLDELVSQHLRWAEQEDLSGLNPQISPVHDFFEQARYGTRGFAEDVLGWESKLKLVQDYFSDDDSHERFIAERFAFHVFAPEQLEALIEAVAASYLQHLGDVDSQLLVRLQADLEGLPYGALPAHLDRGAIEQLLSQAMADAVASVEAEFRGMVEREVVNLVAGEVLTFATTKLATSAGIISVGAGSGTVTFGVGIVVGLIVDYLVGLAYDAIYDPVGEISGRLNETLWQLESLIVEGDGELPGLEGRLLDYARRRSERESRRSEALLSP